MGMDRESARKIARRYITVGRTSVEVAETLALLIRYRKRSAPEKQSLFDVVISDTEAILHELRVLEALAPIM